MLKRLTAAVRASAVCSIECLALCAAEGKGRTVGGTTNWKDREMCRIREYIEGRRTSGMECIHTSCPEEVSGEM